MKQVRLRLILIVVGLSFIAATYWWAADPPNPWFLAVVGAGFLVSVGITIYKHRAGHFG